jgi:hypothetical protein
MSCTTRMKHALGTLSMWFDRGYAMHVKLSHPNTLIHRFYRREAKSHSRSQESLGRGSQRHSAGPRLWIKTSYTLWRLHTPAPMLRSQLEHGCCHPGPFVYEISFVWMKRPPHSSEVNSPCSYIEPGSMLWAPFKGKDSPTTLFNNLTPLIMTLALSKSWPSSSSPVKTDPMQIDLHSYQFLPDKKSRTRRAIYYWILLLLRIISPIRVPDVPPKESRKFSIGGVVRRNEFGILLEIWERAGKRITYLRSKLNTSTKLLAGWHEKSNGFCNWDGIMSTSQSTLILTTTLTFRWFVVTDQAPLPLPFGPVGFSSHAWSILSLCCFLHVVHMHKRMSIEDRRVRQVASAGRNTRKALT